MTVAVLLTGVADAEPIAMGLMLAVGVCVLAEPTEALDPDSR